MGQLFQNFTNITLPGVIMWCIGGLLIYLAIAKKMEPALLLPMGFGAIIDEPADCGRRNGSTGGH